MPSRANASITGVRQKRLPLQPSESQRCWSDVMNRILRPMTVRLSGCGWSCRHSRTAAEKRRALEARFAMIMCREIIRILRHFEERFARGIAHADDLIPFVRGIVADDYEFLRAAPDDAAAETHHVLQRDHTVTAIGFESAQALFRFRAIGAVARVCLVLEQVDHDDGTVRSFLDQSPNLLRRRYNCGHWPLLKQRIDDGFVRT